MVSIIAYMQNLFWLLSHQINNKSLYIDYLDSPLDLLLYLSIRMIFQILTNCERDFHYISSYFHNKDYIQYLQGEFIEMLAVAQINEQSLINECKHSDHVLESPMNSLSIQTERPVGHGSLPEVNSIQGEQKQDEGGQDQNYHHHRQRIKQKQGDPQNFEQFHEHLSIDQLCANILQARKQLFRFLKASHMYPEDQYKTLIFEKLTNLLRICRGDKKVISLISNRPFRDQADLQINQLLGDAVQSGEFQMNYRIINDDLSSRDIAQEKALQEELKSIFSNSTLPKYHVQNLQAIESRAQANPTNIKNNKLQNFSQVAHKSTQIGNNSFMDYTYFQNMVASFQSQSYYYLYQRMKQFQTFIKEKIDQWSLYKATYKQIFKKYLDIFKAKIENMSEWKLIYGSLQTFNNRLEKIVQYKGSKQKARLDATMADLLFQHFIQEIQSRNTRSSIYYVRNPKNEQKIPLADFIAVTKEFFDNAEWSDVFIIVEERLIAKNPSKQEMQSLQNRLKIFENPKPSVVSNKVHLCCSKFFYVKQNIYYPHTKSKIVLAGDITQLTKSLSNVQKQICGLLNSRGGVVLFDCQAISTKVVPRGSQMIEKEMSDIKELLEGCLDVIHPRPNFPEERKKIFVTFVPVAEPQNGQPKFIRGTYVTRITVKPQLGSTTYMIYKQDQKAQIYHRKQSLFSESLQLITGKKLHKFITRKFNQYKDQYSDLTQFERQLLVPTVCDLDHKCELPQIGALMKQKEKVKSLSIDTLRENYKFVSVLVAKQQHHETIKRNLDKKGIKCEIALPFKQSKLKGAAQTAVLYHNNTFDQLLNIVSYNKEFEFGGRYLLIILITPYLRLTDRTRKNQMNEQDFKSLTTWLKNQYPNQSMSLWQFTNDKRQTEYYIKTKQRQALLYIYIVLNQFMERSAFKSPKINDKLPASQREAKLKQLFPKGS